MTTYIYTYSNDNVLEHSWYVGKANDIGVRWNRCKDEKREDNCRKWDLVQVHLKAGTIPFFHTLEVVPMSKWEEREIYWIAYGREQGWPLTNISRGGNGTGTLREDVLVRLRVSQKGKPNTFKGKKHTPEALAKISAASKGKKRSVEVCAKISTAQKGKPKSLEYRIALRVATKGRPGKKHTLEACAKISAAQKGKKLTLEHRKQLSELRKAAHRAGLYDYCKRKPGEFHHSEESRLKTSRSLKEWLETPEGVQSRKQSSEACSRRWSTPAFKATMCEVGKIAGTSFHARLTPDEHVTWVDSIRRSKCHIQV